MFRYLFLRILEHFAQDTVKKQSHNFIVHCDTGLTASDKNMHLPLLEHKYLGKVLPSLHSSALNYADVPFCQVKQAQNCVKKTPVFPVRFISAYKEKYCQCFVFLCFLAVTQQNNSPKQVPGRPLCLQLPTGFCTNSCFKRRQQDPVAEKCLLSHTLPMA